MFGPSYDNRDVMTTEHDSILDGGTMLNRRVFTTGIGALAIAGLAQAIEIDGDDAIRDILKKRVEVEKRTIGMAVCVVTPNRQRFVAYGRERLNDPRPVTSETVFEIGSITKVFTALLVADMARRGELRLDDPVARHLPSDFHLPEFDGRQITLADLATHTSGLPTWPPFGLPMRQPFDAAALSAFFEAVSRFSVEDFKGWLADFHPEPHPPTAAGWWYSNAGYALLGMALAYRGGQSFETLLQARVIKPMGLHDTTFHPTAAMGPRLAEGHDAALKPVPPLDLGIFTAAGGLRSTPRDLSRFAAAILPGSGAGVAHAEQLLLSVRRSAPWIGGTQALGWEELDASGGTFVSKDGVTFGQAASMVFDPDRRVAIMVFSNTFPDLSNSAPSGGGVGAADIARHLLRPKIPLG
jgi:serine-type D-Ala-D-Ala carboxypeptidase/endopeptidase